MLFQFIYFFINFLFINSINNNESINKIQLKDNLYLNSNITLDFNLNNSIIKKYNKNKIKTNNIINDYTLYYDYSIKDSLDPLFKNIDYFIFKKFLNKFIINFNQTNNYDYRILSMLKLNISKKFESIILYIRKQKKYRKDNNLDEYAYLINYKNNELLSVVLIYAYYDNFKVTNKNDFANYIIKFSISNNYIKLLKTNYNLNFIKLRYISGYYINPISNEIILKIDINTGKVNEIK